MKDEQINKNKLIHDLNAPVNNLKMLIELVSKTEMDKAKLLEHLKNILLNLEKNNQTLKKHL